MSELGPALREVPARAVLPSRIDLTPNLPPPRGQGSTQSCSAWSSVYVAATLALRRTNPGLTPLSPSFAYNQVANDPYCQSGSRISTNLDLLRDVGALPLEAFAFDGGWCGRKPGAAELAEAKQNRIRGWSAFDASEPDRVKARLAEGRAVIFSVPMGALLRDFRGGGVLAIDSEPIGRHAMVVVGYDDTRQAFRIQNSWGRGWGEGGYAWFGYTYWRAKVQAGFVID